MIKSKTVLLIGRPGSGKGVQARKLKEFFGEENTVYCYVGDKLRELVTNEGSFSARMVAEKIIGPGNFAPTFLAVWGWADTLIHKVSPEKHVIIDGSPRLPLEAEVLDEALRFYDREDAILIALDIEESVIRDRLAKRARGDDHDDAITSRIARYDENLAKIKEYLASSHTLVIHHVDASGSPEEVFAQIEKLIS